MTTGDRNRVTIIDSLTDAKEQEKSLLLNPIQIETLLSYIEGLKDELALAESYQSDYHE